MISHRLGHAVCFTAEFSQLPFARDGQQSPCTMSVCFTITPYFWMLSPHKESWGLYLTNLHTAVSTSYQCIKPDHLWDFRKWFVPPWNFYHQFELQIQMYATCLDPCWKIPKAVFNNSYNILRPHLVLCQWGSPPCWNCPLVLESLCVFYIAGCGLTKD